MTDKNDQKAANTSSNEDKPSQVTDQRHQARQLALQCLFQFDVQKGKNLDQLESFLTEFCQDIPPRKMARDWILGTWQSLDHIDKLIKATSKNWDISRINPIDRNNLRLAVYQMLDCPDIPTKVVINEAIELAKTFSTAAAPKYINGVLDAINTKINADMDDK